MNPDIPTQSTESLAPSRTLFLINKAKALKVGRLQDYLALVGESCIPGLTVAEVLELEGLAQLELKRFQETGIVHDIHRDIRQFCIDFAEFLPECSHTSREMALAMHWKTPGYYTCRFHKSSYPDKASFIDGNGVLGGVSFRPSGFGMVTDKPMLDDHMQCGCPIEDVLLEFFLFKTRRARSKNPMYKNHLYGMGRTMVTPRMRVFICQGFRDDSGLEIQDIYNQEFSKNGVENRLDALKAIKLLARVQKRRSVVKGNDDGEDTSSSD
ncbi:hypothetical protein GALMADRAFT_1326095 [Galerina marginata CBS 339.88]|uniref:Uncharacterized protein n=1 Tax=Galerina marginata (strain CBS 339.88) TaxID=685588 RepID=A0A067U1L6_GALM3|nr:hypothetical protein GALMADRAFT_1326095 [Galerina marginata CBS 339.88]